jgi:hypothetical protein
MNRLNETDPERCLEDSSRKTSMRPPEGSALGDRPATNPSDLNYFVLDMIAVILGMTTRDCCIASKHSSQGQAEGRV